MKIKKFKLVRFNPVAKHAHDFNKSVVMRNKKKDYRRKERNGSFLGLDIDF